MLACRDPADSEGVPARERVLGYMAGTYDPREALPPRVVLVAVIGDVVVGYAAGHLTRRHGCDGEVEWLYVGPPHRRRGIATALLEALARWFGDHSARTVCVNVLPTNSPAIAMYQTRGARVLNEHWLLWGDVRTVAATA